ncbi:sulfotransferase family protein [Celeribacter litoreus]|uniref:sulfotransferase family protein n=1 Tax=Celeribacter litoreus TaxID=2876714 RepID=UPI001CCDB624|nr:sulfotransferase [Celeribacter litoreus]MCA0045077.1 sulfotransferase [Celeribacter litoreus]
MSKDKGFPDPVFVLAGPRSYSSLVVGMIGQHPELFGLPELNIFQCEDADEFNTGENADGSSKSPFWKSMRHGLLRTIAQVYSGEQTPESIRMAERWLRTRETHTSAQIFHEIARDVAPLRIVEKSPGIIRKQEFMQRMLEACPTARFIHLVRSPIDQCKSALAAKGGVGVLLSMNSVDHRGEEAALEPQILWHDTQIQILRFLDQLDDEQFITLRGEDLLSDTDETLKALCNWLGVSDAPEAIEAMKHPEDSPFACMGPPNAPLGNDVNFLNSPALRPGKVKFSSLDGDLPWRADDEKLHPRVVALAEALGY